MSALGIGRGHGAAPIGQPWLWTLAFWQHEDRTPTHGYTDDARGRDGGFRQKVAARAVLRSGGRSAFGGKPEKHLLILSFSGFDAGARSESVVQLEDRRGLRHFRPPQLVPSKFGSYRGA